MGVLAPALCCSLFAAISGCSAADGGEPRQPPLRAGVAEAAGACEEPAGAKTLSWKGFTTDGATWQDADWQLSPAYPYSSAASGQEYTFTGAELHDVLGVRVTGQTGAESWSFSVSELLAVRSRLSGRCARRA
jgi:hypothetical protein